MRESAATIVLTNPFTPGLNAFKFPVAKSNEAIRPRLLLFTLLKFPAIKRELLFAEIVLTSPFSIGDQEFGCFVKIFIAQMFFLKIPCAPAKSPPQKSKFKL